MADKISITICGDGGCGKSSITLRLVRSQWIHEYDPTIEDSYSVTRNIDGLNWFLSITDTAGQEEYRGLWTASNLKSDAFLLVYDVTNESSLSALDYFIEMIDIETELRQENTIRLRKQFGGGQDVGMPPPIKILAGNKCDLGKVIGTKEAIEYARKNGCGFMETSAKEMVNIEETFALLVRRVVEARQQHYQQGSMMAGPRVTGSATAQTPALTAAEARGTKAERHKRHSRVLGFMKFRKRSEKNGVEVSTTEDKKASAPERKSLWRRIRCC